MPGSMPPTNQLDWLISTTAMIVLFWSRATRDLLKSFGWGIAALHRLDAATKLPFPRRPPHSICQSLSRESRLIFAEEKGLQVDQSGQNRPSVFTGDHGSYPLCSAGEPASPNPPLRAHRLCVHATGCKNYLFSGSDAGREVAAAPRSIR